MNVSKPLDSENLPKRVLGSVIAGIRGLQQQVCSRCGKVWWPRQPVKPLRCPACKSAYWAEPRRPKRGVVPLQESVNEEAATRNPRDGVLKTVVRADEKRQESQDRSFIKALCVLKEMKVAGRTWAEMAERIQTEFGARLDKDQLKALVR